MEGIGRDFRIFKCKQEAGMYKKDMYYAGYIVGDEAVIVAFNKSTAFPEGRKFKRWGETSTFDDHCEDGRVEFIDVTALDGYEVLLDAGHEAIKEGADLLKYSHIIGALEEARRLSNEITKELNGVSFSVPGISRLLELRSQDSDRQNP